MPAEPGRGVVDGRDGPNRGDRRRQSARRHLFAVAYDITSDRRLRRQALGIAAQMAAERFNADHSDRSGSTLACACGRPAQYVSRRPKTFITLMGPTRLERAYYYCPACRRGSCPRDRALDLQDTSLSPGATRLVGMTATTCSAMPGRR